MEFNDIKNELIRSREVSDFDKSLQKMRSEVKLPEFQSTINDYRYSVRSGDVTQTNRFGMQLPTFENYKTGQGNENRLALEQGFLEKAGNGLAKFTAKVGTYATEAVGTMTYGVYSAIKDGDIASLYDNDFTRVMDDANKALDRNFAHYYSDEEKSRGVLGKVLSTNFLFNDFLGGLAFIGGAVLPNLLLAPFTGGATIGTGLAQIGGRAGVKLASTTAKMASRKAGMDVLRNGLRYGSKAGEGLYNAGKTARFVAQSTLFEAGMEARHNFHDTVEQYAEKFYIDNGRIPTIDEMSSFIVDAEKASKSVFYANTALLSITNAAMFGKAFGLTTDMLPSALAGTSNRVGNRLLGLTTEISKDGTKVARELSRSRRLANNAYFLGRKPFSEGIVEEGLQGTFTKTSKIYLDSKYGQNTGDDTFSLTDAWGKAFSEQYGTADGWHEMIVGMLVGATGKNVTAGIGRITGDRSEGFGIEGLGSSGFGAMNTRFQESVNAYNESLKTFKNINRTNSIVNFNDDGSAPAYQDTVASFNYIKTQGAFKDFTNVKEDYNYAVDSLEFTDVQLNQFEENNTTAEAYRESLKQQFEQDFSNYNKASRLVSRLGIDEIDTSNGNKDEIQEAIILQTMLGGKNGDSASRVASEINEMVGKETINALKYMDDVVNPLLKESKENYVKTQNQINAILDEITKTQSDIVGATNENRLELNKKYVVLTQKLTELENEKVQIESIANNEIKNLDGKFGEISKGSPSIVNIIEAENELADFVRVMDASGGNSKSLRNKINQYRAYASTAMEYDSMTQRMLSTNFFKTDEGKNMIKTLTGDKYEGSKEFEQFIRDNEADILEAFGDYGIMPSDMIQKIMEQPDISERAKFKVESLIRASVISKKIQEKADVLTEELNDSQTQLVEAVSIEETQDITLTSPNIQGDTVKGIRMTEQEGENAIEKLSKSINEVADQIREISTAPLSENQQELKDKQQELTRLEQLLGDLENGIVNQQDLIELGITKQAVEEVQTKESTEVQEQQTEVVESITDEDYNRFVDNNIVSEELLSTIVQKVKEGLQLTPREVAIFQSKISDINKLLSEDFLNEGLVEELSEYTPKEVQTEFEWVFDTIEQAEVEQNEGDFERLRELARQQVSGENISTTDNILLMTMYPETFEQYLNEENETVDESVGELRDEDAIGENQSITETEAITGGEFVETEVRQTEIIGETIDRVRERIETTKSEIERLKEPLDFTNTQAFKRYVKLRNKGEERTADEDVEFKSLGESLDNWAFITGTVANGVQLTDWIDQLEHLKSVEVVEGSDTIEASETEVEQVQKQLNSQNNYDVAHNFSHVFSARKTSGDVNVSGMTMETFTDIVGEDIASRTAVGENNTIIIPSSVADEINANTQLFISDSIDGTGSLWTLVRLKTDVDGVETLVPIESDYDTVTDTALDQEEAYEIVERETDLEFQVNVDSEYNKKLLDKAIEEIGLTRELTVEEKEVEIDKKTQQLISSDKTMAKLQGDLLVVQNKKNKTERDKTKITTIREKIKKRERDLRVDAKFKVEKAPRKEVPLSEETRKNLRDNLRVDIMVNGKPVNFLKAVRGGSDSVMKSKMISLRNKLVSDVDAVVRSYFTNTPIESNVKMKAVKVLVGQPNFNMTVGVDNTVMKQHKVFDTQMVENIADIGYIENGEIKTKSGDKVNEVMFVDQSLKNSKGTKGKIPVVIIERGKKRIAYPVNVGRDTPPITEAQIRTVQNNEALTNSEKAMQINTLLGQAGIDVRQTGNSIISYTDNSLNMEALDGIIQQLNQREYVSRVDGWTSGNTTIAQDLVGNATIDIDVRAPFLSPKIKLDMKDVKVDDSVVEAIEKEEITKNVVPINSVSNRVARINQCS